jgi:RNA polymerase sigma-70 factor (ECF subfamily)
MKESGTPAAADAAAAAAAGDETLMEAFGAGDAEAFDVLYARYRGPVFRFFLRQLSREDAEEAHQETWLKLIRAAERYVAQSSFRSYLFTVAHNVLTDRFRRDARRPRRQDDAEADDQADEIDTPMEAHRAQLADRLLRAIRRLPAPQREALVMREETGMSHAEIAMATGATAEGVKSRLRYAMQKLRSELGPHADDL